MPARAHIQINCARARGTSGDAATLCARGTSGGHECLFCARGASAMRTHTARTSHIAYIAIIELSMSPPIIFPTSMSATAQHNQQKITPRRRLRLLPSCRPSHPCQFTPATTYTSVHVSPLAPSVRQVVHAQTSRIANANLLVLCITCAKSSSRDSSTSRMLGLGPAQLMRTSRTHMRFLSPGFLAPSATPIPHPPRIPQWMDRMVYWRAPLAQLTSRTLRLICRGIRPVMRARKSPMVPSRQFSA